MSEEITEDYVRGYADGHMAAKLYAVACLNKVLNYVTAEMNDLLKETTKGDGK